MKQKLCDWCNQKAQSGRQAKSVRSKRQQGQDSGEQSGRLQTGWDGKETRSDRRFDRGGPAVTTDGFRDRDELRLLQSLSGMRIVNARTCRETLQQK